MIPVSREGYKFRSDICLPCYLTDREGILRVSGFMDLAQEIAYWAAEELGFGYTSLHVHHTAWVLSRMHIHFENPAHWRDNVKLYTWHKGANGLFYLRDFDLQDENGYHLVRATSSWVVINEETRRLVRPEDLSAKLETMEKVDDSIEEPAPKLILPKDAEPVYAGDHTVAYSDIDIVGHTNNVRYIVWSMDCIPPEEAARPVKDVFINFNKETTLGEAVSLYRLQIGSTWFVEGRSGGKSCFVAQIDFC
jgi:acyl-ACP thioesterase